MVNDKIKITPKRLKFIEKYAEFDDSETLKEMLFAQQIQNEKLEKIRSDTSKLVWWLIALPIIIFFVFTILGIGGLAI
ncbi:MAG: hypothetical protein V7719_09530 [Psychroserpens sp.]|uniref:hypothetical protein n=1 Tax=Psychroserpens sp. TaxID=2020870 RepID=UPI003001210B